MRGDREDYLDLREDYADRVLAARLLAQRIAAMTPEQKTVYDVQIAERKARVDLIRENNRLFFGGGDFLLPEIKPGSNEYIEKMREASFNGDWETLFRMRVWSQWGQIPLGKFRFEWVNGKPRYKALSKQDYRNYFSGPWINITGEFGSTCPEERINKYTHDYYNRSLENLRKRGPDHPHHIRRIYPKNIICRPKQKSTWVKIRKKVVIAVIIVAAVYLGPVALQAVQNGLSTMTGGLIPAAGGTAGAGAGATATATQLTTFQKIQAGTKTLLGYVNKARTIEAVVKGEFPPPPIGIPGANFRDMVMIVAKDQIKKAAIDAAMEAGTDYIAKKMSAKAEAELKAEIADMQRQLIALIPPEVKAMPPEPDIELAEPLKKIQIIEVKRRDDLQKFVVPAAIIGGALLFGV